MASPNNNNIFYFYLLSLFCSLSITATSSWIANIPLSWWPFFIPVLFMLVIISASGSGFLQLNSGTHYMLTYNSPKDRDPNPHQNVPNVVMVAPENHTDDYRMNGYEDDRREVAAVIETDEIQIEESEFEEIFELDTEKRQECDENSNVNKGLRDEYDENSNANKGFKEEHRRNRITLEMMLLAQANFERKQEIHVSKQRRRIKRARALMPYFLRCFSFS